MSKKERLKKEAIDGIETFVYKNKSVMWHQYRYSWVKLWFNEESKEYECYLKTPFHDSEGNTIDEIEITKLGYSHFHLTPVYCMYSPDVSTIEDYNRMELKEAKISELKKLLDRVEKL
jgi:hypothetical protein